MSVYIAVEGKTEKRLYPRWLSSLLPSLEQVFSPVDAHRQSYYLISGYGYPKVFNLLEDSAKDIIDNPAFRHFVIVVDADANTPDKRRREVQDFIRKNNVDFGSAAVHIIVQTACIESWLLANRRVVPRDSENPELARMLEFYNVREEDPELMTAPNGYVNSIGDFHFKYARAVLKSRKVRYSKTHPNHVGDPQYFEQMKERVLQEPGQVCSLRGFIELFTSIGEGLRARGS